MDGFLHYEFGGLIFGGAYTWRGLFSEFYGIFSLICYKRKSAVDIQGSFAQTPGFN